MSILAKRLRKLETAQQSKGRVISVRVGSHHTDKDIAALLASNDIVELPNDMVVVIRTIYLDRNDNDAPGDGPPILLGVHPMN